MRPRMLKRVAASLFIAATGCLATASAGADAAVVAMGREIVEQHCASCHATGPAGDSPLPAAPPFRDVHQRYDVELLVEALVEGIVTAHAEMPQFEFEPQEAEAIVSYLKSLE